MSSAAQTRRLTPSPNGTRSRRRRLLVPVAIVVIAFLTAFIARQGAALVQNVWLNYQLSTHHATSMKMPTSAVLEQKWGVRFTIVQLEADNGLVELRYVVIDPGKAARLHAINSSVESLPSIEVEGSGAMIKPNSLLFNIHHQYTPFQAGTTYSMIYGNAGGALRPRDLVTIHMADGLVLKDVPVNG